MYDRYSSNDVWQIESFQFEASKCEIQNDDGSAENLVEVFMIHGKISQNSDGFSVTLTNISDKLSQEIAPNIIFDSSRGSGDRLQLITVPQNTDKSCNGLDMLKTFVGHTRYSKNFEKNAPYCCNIFTQNSKITKVTFSFSNPVKLVEFTSQPSSNSIIRFMGDDTTSDKGMKLLAKETLAKSIQNLHKRKRSIIIPDVEAEVINNACLVIFTSRKTKDASFIKSIIESFTTAAKEFFPNDYGEQEATIAAMGIPQNLEWDGMWNHLRKYFIDKHDYDIGVAPS